MVWERRKSNTVIDSVSLLEEMFFHWRIKEEVEENGVEEKLLNFFGFSFNLI